MNKLFVWHFSFVYNTLCNVYSSFGSRKIWLTPKTQPDSHPRYPYFSHSLHSLNGLNFFFTTLVLNFCLCFRVWIIWYSCFFSLIVGCSPFPMLIYCHFRHCLFDSRYLSLEFIFQLDLVLFKSELFKPAFVCLFVCLFYKIIS